jgi:hypothetical protein
MQNKPNYKHQRAERDRAKKRLKDAKLHERKEQAALQKASEIGDEAPGEGPVRDAGE